MLADVLPLAKDNDYNVPLYFGGWYNNDTLVSSLTSEIFTYNSTTGNYEVTLTAKWIEKNTLSINVNQLGTIMEVYYKPGFKFTIPSLESKGITLGDSGAVLINWQLNDGNSYNTGQKIELTTQTELNANIALFVQLSIGANAYTTVNVTLTKNAGYIVTYNQSTGVSTATAFNGETKTNGDMIYVTIGSQFQAKYTKNDGSTNNSASVSGAGSVTSLTTSYQTLTVTDDVSIAPAGEESSGNCFLPTTEIMLADGSIKQAKDITKYDLIVSFNHITGKFEASRISFNVIVDYAWFDAIELTFENGKVLKILTGHGLFNMDTNKYVIYYGNEFIDHIGETFATVDYINGEFVITGSKLVSAVVTKEYSQKFSPLTEYNVNCVGDGMLTIPDDIEGMFDGFTFNNDLTIDMNEFMNDIEQYGVFEYEEVKNIVPEYVFDVFNFKYFKTFILKGVLTIEKVNHWIEVYVPQVIEQSNLDFDFDSREILSEYHLYL